MVAHYSGGITITHMTIGAFATRAGVTVRTIRYYDTIGLLKPSAYTDSGRRLYTELDYARLQQILTLKLIGLSLEEIRSLLTTDVAQIQHLLERQKQVLQEQACQLERIIHFIEQAQDAMRSTQEMDLEQFIHIIKAVNMNTQSDWFAQFTGEQQERLTAFSTSGTLEDQKAIGEAWKTLFEDIRQHQDKLTSDPIVQQLVTRWDALIGQIAPDDPDFAASLTNAYAHMDTTTGLHTTPEDVQAWTQQIRAAALFIQQVRQGKIG